MQGKKTLFSLLVVSIILISSCEGETSSKEQSVFQLKNWTYKTGFTQEDLQPGALKGERTVSLPKNLNKLPELKGYTGWLTLRHKIPDSANKILSQGVPLALNAGRVLDVSYYYINSRQFGQRGSAVPYRDGAMRPFMKNIPFGDFQKNDENYITIVLYSNGKYPLQFIDQIELGASEVIFGRQNIQELLAVSLLMIFLSVSAYHLLLFVRRPQEKYNLYYGLFTLSVSLYWFVANTSMQEMLFQNHVELQRKVEHMLIFILPPLFTAFLQRFFENRNTLAVKIYGIICVSLSFITVLSPLWVMRACLTFWYLLLLPGIIYNIYYIFLRVRDRIKPAYYMAGGILVFCLSVIYDALLSEGLLKGSPISSYSFLLLVVGIAGLMADRFVKVTARMEELNGNLEKKVEERTQALSKSLTRVQELKHNQDGDYFLTSLLIAPLAVNHAQAETVNVNTLSRQKKKFIFRHRHGEIGGDINIADEFDLPDGRFTVFMNADAMGKSIQGAGGALVLGTVFRSLISRTIQRDPALSELYPEAWLEKCYSELQNVFETFEGSMLVSSTIGLVNNFNGMMYYLNAEHPWLVLYRAGQASFLDTEMEIHKLGSIRPENGVRVKTFRLQPNDVIISGSDGRDDLLLSRGDETIMNEDETSFLSAVEQSLGKLPSIESNLQAIGDLTDDLSLVSIAYRPNEQAEAHPADYLQPEKLETFLERIRLSIREKQPKDGFDYCEKALKKFPDSEEVLFQHGHLLKLNGDFRAALISAERLFLRNRVHVRNICNMADIYACLGKPEQARASLKKADDLAPTDPLVIRLRRKLNELSPALPV